ncbi:MAG TPA: hypothetical protein VK694_05910 [Verrucomicrobiae bacterium]|nr:hypothetical protein [Verrucomicrobiae bacterium]
MKISRQDAWDKVREWLARYLPAEITGTITALGGFWIAYQTTGSLAVAAVCGTIGENVGYYGVISLREVLRYWQSHHHHARLKRLWLTGVHTIRDMLVEFGTAEILDSFVVRPGLFYLLPTTFSNHKAVALIAAKLVADLVFYTFAIIGYEVRKKFLPRK